jgi:hypothetical protein
MEKLWLKLKNIICSKGLFGKIIVILCIYFIIRYTNKVLTIFENTGVEPTILTPLVYSFFGGELVILFLKKKNDKKKESEDIDNGVV